MKIGLYAKHAGLIDLLYHLWKDKHDVRLAPSWAGFEGKKDWQGDEDIIVSTLPYDTESLTTGKPTIVYYTDPTFPHFQKEVQSRFDKGELLAIGAEDCYLPEHFITGVKKFIPFAVNPARYPKYEGFRKEIIVVNQKPLERWEQVIRGATGVYTKLEDLLDGFNWHIVDEDDVMRFRKEYAENRVLFYYSNSPYTIVMFEAMTVGMPIVAFNHHHASKSHPIEKYLNGYHSTDIEEIRNKLKREYEEPVGKFYESLPNFDMIQQEWGEVFKSI